MSDLLRWLAGRLPDDSDLFGCPRWYEESQPDLWLRLREERVTAYQDGEQVPLPWEE
ncbi:hypothetical protein [Streptomyces sp. AJS327]|uniref:hypothetical protein n=1 Tax=Streptomyces sp. AJS327 TaxID=2545265 RepID=UPI0015DF6C79|nr:hypothetical protein [Streptomyces sp. AJS327]